jgi:hypothetical protein
MRRNVDKSSLSVPPGSGPIKGNRERAKSAKPVAKRRLQSSFAADAALNALRASASAFLWCGGGSDHQ